jgi:phage gp46-like protein
MNFVPVNDAIGDGFGACDISLDGGTPLQSHVLASIMIWRRCAIEELDIDDNRQGWWADADMGSRIWTLRRSKLTDAVVGMVKAHIQEALQWMIDSGLCASVTVGIARQGDRVNCEIAVNKADGGNVAVKFDDLWALLVTK